MENQKLQDLIRAKQQVEAEKKTQEMFAQEKRLADYAERLNKYNEQVREWIENIRTIVGNGYSLYSPSDNRWKTPTAFEKLFTIRTDGIYHGFGVFNDGTLGIQQGGACGDWHIHTDGNSWWIQCSGQRKPLRENDYEELFYQNKETGLNCIERFAKKMDAIYDYFNL